MPASRSAKAKKIESALILFFFICLAMIFLEITVFNMRHWTTRFIAPRVNALEHTSFRVDRPTPERQAWQPLTEPLQREIMISNINHPIHTVFVRPQFGNSGLKAVNVSIRYHDENNIITHTTHIINGYTPSFHIPIGAMGDVSRLSVIFHNELVSAQEVHFNTPLPWNFRMSRVLLFSFIVTFIWLWKKYKFSDVLFDPKLRWQKCLGGCVTAVFILILFLTMFFSVDFGFIPGSGNEFDWAPHDEEHMCINGMMVEALLMGQLHLDLEPHESLLNAAQPHSIIYRAMNNVETPWDHVFFNGRFYSYFGITPVVLLLLPYYAIRGVHLSSTVATFIFSAIGAIGIYFLWKELAKKYLEDIPYTLYLAGLAAALFGSNLMLMTVRALPYEVALSGGLMFSVWGLYFILRAVQGDSYENIKTRFLVFGGICLALAVGSRPTMIFASLMVPVLLLPAIRSLLPLKDKYGSLGARKTIVVNVLALAAPYVVIGAALAWYNFARFGSIFEFGATYQLTGENVAVVTSTGLLGNLRRAYDGIFVFLFTNFGLQSSFFPFVSPTVPQLVFTGYMARTATIGAALLPVTWFLPGVLFIRKNDSVKRAAPVIIGMVIVGMFIAILSTVLIGAIGRYTVDFFWLFILPSLICMGLVYKEALKLGDGAAVVIRRLSFTAIGVSCFILFAWGMVGENNLIWVNNPVVLQFLSDLFVIL